jgi:hypothetical protein
MLDPGTGSVEGPGCGGIFSTLRRLRPARAEEKRAWYLGELRKVGLVSKYATMRCWSCSLLPSSDMLSEWAISCRSGLLLDDNTPLKGSFGSQRARATIRASSRSFRFAFAAALCCSFVSRASSAARTCSRPSAQVNRRPST